MTHYTSVVEHMRELTRFEISSEREADGRWIAAVSELPGALAYGDS